MLKLHLLVSCGKRRVFTEALQEVEAQMEVPNLKNPLHLGK
jgi:hypothetical protein